MAPQPKYKLTYFPAKGIAEPIRFILSHSRVNFEDVRCEFPDWQASIKATMPFGRIPTLEIDGKVTHQSVAISRFLGKKYGLGGSTDLEDLHIDSVVDTFMDIRQNLADMYFDTNKESKSKKKEPLKEIIPFYLSKLDEIVKKNGGYFVGKRLTWADLFWVGIVDYLGTMSGFRSGAELVETFRNLKEHQERILAIPTIRAWVAKRPKTPL